MTYDEIRHAWNAQADDGNRWHSLSEAEKIEWAAIHASAKERTARQAAQVEVAELKGRIARAGVEQRRAVLEAVLEEREACALACEIRAGSASLLASSRDAKTHADATKNCASAIRARAIEDAHGITQEKQG